MTLGRNLAAVKNEFAGVKVKNASFQLSRSSVDDEIVVLENDVVEALKARLSWLNIT